MTPFETVIVGHDTLTGECARQVLDRGHRIAALVTRNADLRQWATDKGIRVEAPGRDLGARLNGLACDWLLSIANLDILQADLLALPKRGAVNFHDGPLPRYAGLNAPVWALLQGEARHGITWHKIEGGVDEGDILVQRMFDVAPEDTALSLNLKCYAAAVESFAELLTQLESPAPQSQTQDLAARSYFGLNDRPAAMGMLRLDHPAMDVARMVRALDHGGYLNPLTTAKLRIGDRLVVVSRAEVAPGSGSAGTVLAVDPANVTVACGEGAVRLSGLRGLDGADLDVAGDLAVGDQLPVVSEADAQALTELGATLAPADRYWRKRLGDFAPAALVDTTAEGVGVAAISFAWPAALSPDQKAEAVAFWAAQNMGTAQADIALTHAGLDHGSQDFALNWVPFRAGDDLTKLLARVGVAADIGLRDPEIGAVHVPDVALVLAGTEPLAGAKVTVTADGTLHHDRARIGDAMAQLLAQRLTTIAEAMAQGDSAPQMPATERDLLLHGWNQTKTAFDEATTIHRFFEIQTSQTPDAPALVTGGDALTYAELNARANRAAHVLRAKGVGPGSLVGLCTHRNAHLVVGALAILKAGGAYVPMDPAYPADRLALYLEDSGATVVLSESALRDTLPESNAEVLLLDSDAALNGAANDNPTATAMATDLAYLIYTSGSTGRPKGVMVEHRNVSNFFTGMDARIGRDTPGSWLAVTSLSFDISVLEIFYSLARGYKLVLVNEEQKLETSVAGDGMEFSLFYWGNDDGVGRDKYRSLLEGAKFADENGFCAVWTPERHFHAFGGPYPNPSVTGAAVAGATKNIAVRAGSCVAPLHHTARIAEEWAVIDNLTNGRAGLAIASGWQPDDFVLRPENTPPDNKPAMLRQIDELRRLWAGEPVEYAKKDGTMHAVVTQPRPVSKKLPIWVTTAGNPATWQEAGKIGANVLTHLLGQSVDEVAGKIEIYHAALREAGHDPADFKVTLMLHTYVAATRDAARDVAREPMKGYLRSAAGLIKQYAWAFPAFKRPEGATNAFDLSLDGLTDEEMDAILDFAFQRYFDDSGLFGTVEDCVARVDSLKTIGVTEVACLIDYGIAVDQVLDGLRPLAEVLRRCNIGADTDYSIAAQIARHDVTHLQCTPSMARLLLLSPDTRAALRRVDQIMLGGEPLAGALVDELRSMTDAKIENMYGPTETTIWSSTAPATGGEAICDIGTPIANTQMYVLDEAGDPAPVGVVGELFIGGDGVTRGYFQRDDLTAERFVANPFAPGRMYNTGDLARWRADGRIDFLGRADTQVKLRGYRIELGEIEARLEAMAGVKQAVVVVQGGQTLVAFLNGSASADDLRRDLAADVPDYMVPQRFENVSEFPLTPNRKVDRKALSERSPAPVTKPVAVPVAPQSTVAEAPAATPKGQIDLDDIQARIADIWRATLGVADISPSSNFFDLGGHSLLAVQVHRELRKELGLPRLSIADVFGFPTLAGLTARIGEIGGAAPARKVRNVPPPPANSVAVPRPAQAETTPESDNPRASARLDAMARRREMRARRGA
ncbi:LLM class flavin-dependent oxidoreductase [Marinovum sp. 2_MG-2023]|uniref:MupA/Atu3671 family FMN-dependent luciferase-like monooxygenase n=1 Tax=unclassified Marinovum TaxID=2647166 RepID=UPI0026E1BCCC|nr:MULTISPECIES: MupA/Atu3671 family FMN-dependent luciferase-like monooxygenase [unclassified Marinovum]MDO6730123.1 LLM class flavin-dependent oxidoreductase [Marinovum sp. 2_MG-2023]MDO6778861.1 LLM class flavin-dependent oxidoreductase [Marinovum sp. 1_MG-2023]